MKDLGREGSYFSGGTCYCKDTFFSFFSLLAEIRKGDNIQLLHLRKNLCVDMSLFLLNKHL